MDKINMYGNPAWVINEEEHDLIIFALNYMKTHSDTLFECGESLE